MNYDIILADPPWAERGGGKTGTHREMENRVRGRKTPMQVIPNPARAHREKCFQARINVALEVAKEEGK